MRLEPIPPERIAHEWPWLWPLLKPAVDRDDKATQLDVLRKLKAREAHAVIARVHGAVAVIVCETGIHDGTHCAWIRYLAGQFDHAPKAFVQVVREGIAVFENWAREQGCSELRLGGRKWQRVLDGYEPYGGMPNGLRKVL